MRMISHLAIAMVAMLSLLGPTVVARPEKKRRPNDPASSPSELGTGSGSRRDSTNTNTNRISRDNQRPVVKSLEDEVHEAFGECLKGWFNGWLWRKGFRWDIYVLQCRDVAREVGHYLVDLPEITALDKEPTSLRELQRVLGDVPKAAPQSSPEDHERLYQQDSTTKTNANSGSDEDLSIFKWGNLWSTTTDYFIGPRIERDRASGRLRRGFSKPGSRPFPR